MISALSHVPRNNCLKSPSRRVKILPSCVPGIRQNSSFTLSVSGLSASLAAQCTWALFQAGQLNFKIPNFSDLAWWELKMVLKGRVSPYYTGTDAGLSQKYSHTKAQGCGVWSKA